MQNKLSARASRQGRLEEIKGQKKPKNQKQQTLQLKRVRKIGPATKRQEVRKEEAQTHAEIFSIKYATMPEIKFFTHLNSSIN